MHVRLVKMRDRGVELDRRVVRETTGHRGLLVIMDISDQRLRRPAKVARLMQAEIIRHELTDVHIVWLSEGRFTLAGFERHRNSDGTPVDYARPGYATSTSIPFPTSYWSSNGMSDRRANPVLFS
jgi:hypothetical protein